jgi:plasmid stabilization system protein ParE
MVRKIVWSERAAFDRKEILDYWINRNKSKTFSKKLNKQIKNAILLISEFPDLGIPTDMPNIRLRIWILTIWDGRRNPQKLNL